MPESRRSNSPDSRSIILLYVLYSSGTTGVPKCIVHGAGGTLLQHLKEQQLHCDVEPRGSLFYFTTCGWTMWNILVSALASGATVLMYDGSPFVHDGRILFELAEVERMTHLRHVREVHRRGRQGRTRAGRRVRPDSIRVIAVHRQSARARELRLRLSIHRVRRAAVVHVRRNGHLSLRS